jgi:hypothetical protein
LSNAALAPIESFELLFYTGTETGRFPQQADDCFHRSGEKMWTWE